MSRTTQDIDGIVRTDFDEYLGKPDAALAEHWGPLSLTRGDAEEIHVPSRIVNPRRFNMKATIKAKGFPCHRLQGSVFRRLSDL